MNVQHKKGSDAVDKFFNPASSSITWKSPNERKVYTVASTVFGIATLGIGHGIYQLIKKCTASKIQTNINKGNIEAKIPFTVRVNYFYGRGPMEQDELNQIIADQRNSAIVNQLTPQELGSQIEDILKKIGSTNRFYTQDENKIVCQKQIILLRLCSELMKYIEFSVNFTQEDKDAFYKVAEHCLKDDEQSDEIKTEALAFQEKILHRGNPG